jgi:hypothetical protein
MEAQRYEIVPLYNEFGSSTSELTPQIGEKDKDKGDPKRAYCGAEM